MKGTDQMTDTTHATIATHNAHSDVSPADASPDYEKTLRVHAAPDALFDALTTVDGLSAWWSRVDGSGETGGELKFYMNAPEPCVMHVDAATRPTAVQWTVTACDFLLDWVGTRPTFTITDLDDGTSELHFRHGGLTQELDCIEMCTRGWDHFVPSLRDYVETGTGSPLGSPGDKARRARERSEV
jgi:uncharacterized protein YndB with AHSA1/START domain